ncbi:MAG: IS110 family transposase [Desulfamplus sp.]|nr:IS110 family transposase [Desulfamplus sp.]
MIQPLSKSSAGLDVHREIIVATVLQEQPDGTVNKTVKEFATFSRNLEELARWLTSLNPEIVVMESTGVYWMQVYETLETAGMIPWVVNAYHIKRVPGRKTDVQDSEWLAELARCGLLRASFIPPKDFRQLRLLTRYRRKLSGVLSSEKNRLHKILESCGIKLGIVLSDIDGVSARRIISSLIDETIQPDQIAALLHGSLLPKLMMIQQSLSTTLNERQRFLLKQIQAHLLWLEARIEQIDEQLVTAMVPYQEFCQLLQTIPGIDLIAATMLLAELGTDMSVFPNQQHLCSWAGLAPGNNESAGKRKHGKTRKGNAHIRALLCECANAAIKSKSQFKGRYQGLVIRRGHKRSIVAIAHKLLQTIYVMLKKHEPYRDPQIDYEELVVKRNSARWIKALDKYGYLPKIKQQN